MSGGPHISTPELLLLLSSSLSPLYRVCSSSFSSLQEYVDVAGRMDIYYKIQDWKA